jgi:hypothetical protein
MRVQQVRNIGAIEGNPPVSANDWETVRRGGEASIQRWIDENMKYKQCVIVLVGEETANRPWVRYEIEKAWSENRPMFGIHIHNFNCPRNGASRKGINPFETFQFENGEKLSTRVNCYDPSAYDAYNDVAKNMEHWVNLAIMQRK